jgi:hypothetical protein
MQKPALQDIVPAAEINLADSDGEAWRFGPAEAVVPDDSTLPQAPKGRSKRKSKGDKEDDKFSLSLADEKDDKEGETWLSTDSDKRSGWGWLADQVSAMEKREKAAELRSGSGDDFLSPAYDAGRSAADPFRGFLSDDTGRGLFDSAGGARSPAPATPTPPAPRTGWQLPEE